MSNWECMLFVTVSIDLENARHDPKDGLHLWIINTILQKVLNPCVSSLISGANPFQTVLRMGADSGFWRSDLERRFFTTVSLDLEIARYDLEDGFPLWIINTILKKVMNSHFSSLISGVNLFHTELRLGANSGFRRSELERSIFTTASIYLINARHDPEYGLHL